MYGTESPLSASSTFLDDNNVIRFIGSMGNWPAQTSVISLDSSTVVDNASVASNTLLHVDHVNLWRLCAVWFVPPEY